VRYKFILPTKLYAVGLIDWSYAPVYHELILINVQSKINHSHNHQQSVADRFHQPHLYVALKITVKKAIVRARAWVITWILVF